MSYRREPKAWLEDIIAWGNFVADHIADKTPQSFAANLQTQHAVMKCIEVIGEACGQVMKLEPDYPSVFPDLDLRTAYAMRNKLSHGYFEIAAERLWSAATLSVPQIVVGAKAALARIADRDDL